MFMLLRPDTARSDDAGQLTGDPAMRTTIALLLALTPPLLAQDKPVSRQRATTAIKLLIKEHEAWIEQAYKMKSWTDDIDDRTQATETNLINLSVALKHLDPRAGAAAMKRVAAWLEVRAKKVPPRDDPVGMLTAERDRLAKELAKVRAAKNATEVRRLKEQGKALEMAKKFAAAAEKMQHGLKGMAAAAQGEVARANAERDHARWQVATYKNGTHDKPTARARQRAFKAWWALADQSARLDSAAGGADKARRSVLGNQTWLTYLAAWKVVREMPELARDSKSVAWDAALAAVALHASVPGRELTPAIARAAWNSTIKDAAALEAK
jgi:hypothetical protein